MQVQQLTRSRLAGAANRASLTPFRPASRPVVLTRATLFEKLGGKDAVNLAVDKFYEKVLADDRVSAYFQGKDMKKQRAHQAAFMTMAFGGPNAYKGKDMAAAHSHLMPHLEESHFNAIVEHFAGTLQDLGVAQEDIDAAVAVVATTKDAVLSRDTAVPAK